MMDKNLQIYEQRFTSWTDDVPTCKDSGVGSSCNEVYRKDGRRVALHEYEDRSFRFRREEYNLCLYGVIDGFNGANVSDFIMKCLPAELVLGQLVPDITDDQLKDLVKQAFVFLDKEYFDSIGEKLAARMVMRVEGEQSNSALLKELEQLVSCGCSATIATILDNRLWVSNIGDCQAFLCYQSDGEEDVRISTLSIDHYLSNEDESLRLQHLGYDPPLGDTDTGLGDHNYTRCFGNYLVKGGYKETPILASCGDDPVIAEPEIQGPIEITEDLELLVIATKSLCEAVESCCEDAASPQSHLVRLLRHHLAAEPYSSLSTVAQSTVDHIVRMYTEKEQIKSTSLIKREDMTLLVRCFNNLRSGQQQQRRTSSPKYPSDNGSLRRREEKTLTRSSARPRPTRSSTTTESSGVYMAHGRELPVDEDGRIEPYVDFGPFYKLWNAREENGVTNQTNNLSQ